MGDVKLNSSGGGSVTLTTPSTASNYTVTLPAATSTLIDTTSTQTLTNKTLTAAGSNTVEATSGPTSTQLAGQRNKIINGAMMIDQRNAGASVTQTTSGLYTLDRWKTYGAVASKFTVQQNASSITPPVGFSNYLGVTSSSAYTVGSTDEFDVYQPIEGFNTADLGWGAVGAASVTLSFWVRSSLTGNFGGSVRNSATNYSYPFSYTINAANTWEQKSLTIAGPTSGTWIGATNGIGMLLNFSMGAGSTLSGTASSWSANNYTSATGAVSVVGTSGATWYVTGVQLEKGATATPFENRLYGTELALCQRYYQITTNVPSIGATASTTLAGNAVLKVTMRSTPSVGAQGVLNCSDGSNDYLQSSANATYINGNTESAFITMANFTGLTQYRPYIMSRQASNSNGVTLSAEL